jgi:predicted secreted protein
MAIINASDLLVYKKSPADVAQVTRIRVLKVSPLSGVGSVKILNTTDSSGNNVAELETLSVSNNGFALLSVIRATLNANGYTGAGSIIDDGDFYYLDFTNTFPGDVNTLSFADGTATINEGAIEVIVITSGQNNNDYEPIAHSTSASVSFNMDLRDTTTKDSGGFQDNEGGLRSFELSTDALQDVNADLDFKEFFTDISSRSEVTVRFSERDTGVKWEGLGIVTSASMDAGVEDNTTYSVSITGTGVSTQGTY